MGSSMDGAWDVIRSDDRAAPRLLQARCRRSTIIVEELLHQERFQAAIVGRSRRQADIAAQAARLPKKIALLVAADDLHHAADDRAANVRMKPSAYRDDLGGIPADVIVPAIEEILRGVETDSPKLEDATARPVFAEARFVPQAQIRRRYSIRSRGLGFFRRSRRTRCRRGCALLASAALCLDVR